MSDCDDVMSSTESLSDRNSPDTSDSSEMVVMGIVRPYADEPIAHSSDEEDSEEDQDGLTPAVLRARFEGQDLVNNW